MAVRFGMTIAEIIAQLTRGFRSVAGRAPDGLEKIKIQQEAVQRFKDMNKIVDMQGRTLDPSKTIMGGTQEGAALKSGIMKATGAGPKKVSDSMKKQIEDKYGITLQGDETMGEIQKIIDDLPTKKAQGGRIGYKIGSIDKARRAFLKTVGVVGAGIGALKTGILGLTKGAAPVATEAVKETVTQAPSYFFDLAAKIKTLGRMSDGPSERIKEYSMKGKDGKSEFLLTEDIGTGEMQIKKIGKENDEMISDIQTMEYTPGSSLADETTKGIPADQYDEYTEFQSRIYKDEFNDPDIVDGINVEDIIKEVKDQAPPIKKAGGGIARMLGE